MSRDRGVPTVLLVDDDSNVTAALVRSMRREPYSFLTAQSASEALLLMAQHHVDVLVADETMPQVSGSELLAIVHRRFPACVRIILSGQSNLEAAIRMINEGQVYRFLQKSCSPIDVAATIRQALQYKRLQDLSRSLLRQHRRQARLLRELKVASTGIIKLGIEHDGTVVAKEDEAHSLEDLVRELQSRVS